MKTRLHLSVDRSGQASLSEQIHAGIKKAIETGVLEQGVRLPSWQDLAAELGVARGTIRAAYDKLAAAQLIEASRSGGTRVAQRPSVVADGRRQVDGGPFMNTYLEMTQGPALFQMGVPATDVFPATLFARLHGQAARTGASAPLLYPDPRGELELRREIASFLALARGMNCSPDQVIVTNGYAAGLGLALGALKLAGHAAWLEEPSFPWSRRGVELVGLSIAPIPVDAQGIDVEYAMRSCPSARLAIVTPGQQAPFGHTLSLDRRLLLLDWAAAHDAWVVEDDYLSELQLTGRAAPALASLDRAGRVIHIGSFSKTISPTLPTRLRHCASGACAAVRGDGGLLGASARSCSADGGRGVHQGGPLSETHPPHEAALRLATAGGTCFTAKFGLRRRSHHARSRGHAQTAEQCLRRRGGE